MSGYTTSTDPGVVELRESTDAIIEAARSEGVTNAKTFEERHKAFEIALRNVGRFTYVSEQHPSKNLRAVIGHWIDDEGSGP